MSMTETYTTPPVEVTAPALVPYPFGLFSVAPAATPTDDRWTNGVWWSSVGCNVAGVTFDPCNVDDPVPEKSANVLCNIVDAAVGFTVYARSDLSVGGRPLAERFDQARTTLLGGEQYAAEAGLWAALVGATTSVATVETVNEAVAIAEARIAAAYGGTPVIHIGRYGAILAHDVLSASGTRLTTMLGSSVVAGGGYAPTAPDAGESFDVIATGALVVLRGIVNDLGEHIDRDTNSVSAVAERSYAIGWDCAAVRVTVTPPEA